MVEKAIPVSKYLSAPRPYRLLGNKAISIPDPNHRTMKRAGSIHVRPAAPFVNGAQRAAQLGADSNSHVKRTNRTSSRVPRPSRSSPIVPSFGAFAYRTRNSLLHQYTMGSPSMTAKPFGSNSWRPTWASSPARFRAVRCESRERSSSGVGCTASDSSSDGGALRSKDITVARTSSGTSSNAPRSTSPSTRRSASATRCFQLRHCPRTSTPAW